MKKIKLTKKKEKWASQFKPKYIEGEPIRSNVAIEKKAANKLLTPTKKMVNETLKEVEKLFKKETPSCYAQDASLTSQIRILFNALNKNFDNIFSRTSDMTLKYIVDKNKRHNDANVKNSLKKLSGGLVIDTKDLTAETKEFLKAGSNQASKYIKSIPEKYLDQVENAVYRSIQSGEGLKTLIPEIQKINGQTEKRAKFIAIDQTQKVNSSLTEARLKQSGVSKFKWKHSGGGMNPRATHLAFNNKIYSFDNPPYDSQAKKNVMPGELPNCKCFLVPILEF